MRRQDASQPENPIQAGAAGRLQDSSVEETAAWFGQSDVNMRMRDVYQMANRNNTSIYSLDPRGLAVFEFGSGRFGRDAAVRHRPPRAADDAGHAARRCRKRPTGAPSSTATRYYEGLTADGARLRASTTCSRYSSRAPTDGKFHEIKVRIKRRGVEARVAARATGPPRPPTC